jgi:hypothetical protein
MSTGTSPTDGQQTGDAGVQRKAQQAAGQAQEKAEEAAAQAKGKLREQLDQRSAQAAEQINQQASDLRAVGDSLREQGKTGPAGAADRLAEYAEKVGGYLRDKDSDELLADVEDLGRKQPWAVGAGALALGFAASRFLKASSGKRYSSRLAPQPVAQRPAPHAPAPIPSVPDAPARPPVPPVTPSPGVVPSGGPPLPTAPASGGIRSAGA